MRQFSAVWPVAVAGAAALVPQGAVAQETANSGPEAILVIANRAPVVPVQIGQSVAQIVIDPVAEGPSASLAELLARSPGIQFRRNGGRGATTSLFIRGADSGQTAILYDGVRLLDPSSTDGSGSLADIPLGQIARVEVLRGSQSTLYGSQAIGGVINILTADPHEAFAADLQGELGTRGSRSARGHFGGTSKHVTWRAGASREISDGVSAYAAGTERDGYRSHSVNGRVTYRPADRLTVDLRSLYSHGNLEFDGFNADAANRAKTETWLNRAALTVQAFDGFETSLAYARTDIDRRNLDETIADSPVTTFDASGSSDRIEYQGTLHLSDSDFAVFGAEYAQNTSALASYGGAPATTGDDTLGVFAQLSVLPAPGLTLTGGVRREDHSTFGGKTVPSASFAWTPDDGRTIARASYSAGFKAPSLYQLFSEYGNRALAPETARSWDVGAERQLVEMLTISATYYRRTSHNLVDFVSCSADPGHALCADGRFGFYDNIGAVEVSGAELAASLDLGAISASANYTLLDTENVTQGAANFGHRLARRSRHTGNAQVTYACACGATLGARLSVVGAIFNDAANSQRLAGHVLIDLHAAYPLGERIEIYARIENLFDESYELVRDFGTLPRMAYAGARLTF